MTERKRTHKNVSFDIPKEDHQKLVSIAKVRGETLAQLMRSLLYSSRVFDDWDREERNTFFSEKSQRINKDIGVNDKLDLFE